MKVIKAISLAVPTLIATRNYYIKHSLKHWWC